MKITKPFLLGLAVIFLSCGEDDDPLPTSQGMLGAWAMTAVDYTGTSTTTALGNSIKVDYAGTGKDMNLTTTFTENPNTVTSEGNYIIVLKTTAQGQTSTAEYPFDEVVTDGTWTLTGNTLTVTDSNGAQKATILSQTSTTFKMRMDVKESESSLGITVSTDIHITYTFERK